MTTTLPALGRLRPAARILTGSTYVALGKKMAMIGGLLFAALD